MRRAARAGAVAALAAAVACGGPEAPPAGGGAAVSRDWTPIARWSGHGSRQTETFTMLRHEWRLRWEATAQAGAEAPLLRVSVHSADSGRVLAVPLEGEAPGSGVVEVVEEPRQFYLMVEGSGVEWAVAVEEAGGPRGRDRESP